MTPEHGAEASDSETTLPDEGTDFSVRDPDDEPEPTGIDEAGPASEWSTDGEVGEFLPVTFERQALSSSVRWVWFVGYLIPTLVTTLVVLQLDIFVFQTRTGVATAATMIALLGFSVWRTTTRYRCWSWELDETELIIDRGVVFKLTRIIPRVRIQHVDLSSGPVDRLFDLRQLSIYTAGTREADASIPGLGARRAEELRHALIARK